MSQIGTVFDTTRAFACISKIFEKHDIYFKIRK